MTADSLARAAIAYAERLRWPVFLLAGKVPVIKDGRGCLDATTDLGAIGSWWREYLTIHGCTIVQQSGQKAWVALPSQRADDDGRCR